MYRRIPPGAQLSTKQRPNASGCVDTRLMVLEAATVTANDDSDGVGPLNHGIKARFGLDG